jgi:peptide/nickel transport system permease protein
VTSSRLKASIRAVVSSPTGLVALVLCLLVAVVAIIGPVLWGTEAETIKMVIARQGVSAAHPLGTDQLGRDVLARTLAASRLSVKLALITAALGAALGIPLGAAVGVIGRRWQRLVAGSIKLSLTFPAILVAIFLVTIIGPGQTGVVVAIGVALAPHFARTAQTLAASIADSDFMAAARVVGIRRGRLLRRYVLPNTAEALVLQTANAASVALVVIAAFSFLGLGVQSPQFDWGRMLAEGLQSIYVTPSVALAPGVAITIAGVAFSLLGEAIARGLNPAVRVAAGTRRLAGPKVDGASAASKPAARLSAAAGADRPLVIAENLRVRFPRGPRTLDAVAGIDLTIAPGEIVGVVGESGSGKTMLSLALAGLVPYPGEVTADRLEFMGTDLLAAPRRQRASLLGMQLAVVFQDPISSLNPALRVGRQIAEKAEVHMGAGRREALALAQQGLAETHIPAPARRLRQYPHEYSGGMRQRAMIAMGLITNPALFIADEPTTSLDVTVQAQILDLLRGLNREHGAAILFISHDMAVVSELCSRIVVMYAGRVVETIPAGDLSRSAAHPYTRALMSTVVDLDADRERPLATIAGRAPRLDALPTGCPFSPRCPLAEQRCFSDEPPLELHASGSVACWVAAETSSSS